MLYPDKYAIQKKDEKISDLILRAGGMTPLAYIDGATLLRKVQLSEAEIEMRRKTISDLTISAQSTQPIQAEELSPEKQEAMPMVLWTEHVDSFLCMCTPESNQVQRSLFHRKS